MSARGFLSLITCSSTFVTLLMKVYLFSFNLEELGRRFKPLRYDWIILEMHKAAEKLSWIAIGGYFLTRRYRSVESSLQTDCRLKWAILSYQVGLPKHSNNTRHEEIVRNILHLTARRVLRFISAHRKSDWFRSTACAAWCKKISIILCVRKWLQSLEKENGMEYGSENLNDTV
jgi:hypothetical protein